MGKNKKDNRVDEGESYSYSSRTSDSSTTRSSNSSDSSDSESSRNSSEKEKKKKAKKKSSKLKKDKKVKRNTSDGSDGEHVEYDEREKKKKIRHAKHKGEADDRHINNHDMREDDKKHRSGKKHKHHHHKHKHKHRHHRHHHSEDRQERRRGPSPDRSELRKGREEEDRKYKDRLENEKSDRERRMDRDRGRDTEKKDRREERKQKERFESRQIKSRWDDDDTQIEISKRIKIEEPYDDEDAGIEQSSRRPDFDQRLRKLKNEKGNDWQEDDRDFSENGRSGWGTANNDYDMKEENSKPGEEKHKPNMGLSGKLTEDSNTYNGVVIKYSQPPEARKPKRRWRWYIFRGDEDLPFLPLHRQSAYLIGRDRKVADIPTDHPSCSKQHAVLQYRLVSYNREDGTKGRTVKPYILDLESANGTYINNRRIEPRRFVELLEKDVVKFGYSSREYILLHEGSKGEEEDVPDTGVEQELSPVSLLRS